MNHLTPKIENMDFSKVNTNMADPLNKMDLDNIPKQLWGYEIQNYHLEKLEPPLPIVRACENNPELKKILFPHITGPVEKFPLLTDNIADYMQIEEANGNLKSTTELTYDNFVAILSEIYNYHLASASIAIVLTITLILTVLYTLSFGTSVSSKDYEKLSAYECGFEPIHSNARIKFDVIYWIIGILY